MTFNKKVYPWVTTLFGIPDRQRLRDRRSTSIPWNVTGQHLLQLEDRDRRARTQCRTRSPSTGRPQGSSRPAVVVPGVARATSQCTDAGWDFNDGKGKDPGLEPGGDAQVAVRAAFDRRPGPDHADDRQRPHRLGERPQGRLLERQGSRDLRPGHLHQRQGPQRRLRQLGVPERGRSGSSRAPTTSTSATAADSLSAECVQRQRRQLGVRQRADQANNVHQWCIGGANASGYQQIIAGTPFNWDPTRPSTSRRRR